MSEAVIKASLKRDSSSLSSECPKGVFQRTEIVERSAFHTYALQIVNRMTNDSAKESFFEYLEVSADTVHRTHHATNIDGITEVRPKPLSQALHTQDEADMVTLITIFESVEIETSGSLALPSPSPASLAAANYL